jgi:hypothetical protein
MLQEHTEQPLLVSKLSWLAKITLVVFPVVIIYLSLSWFNGSWHKDLLFMLWMGVVVFGLVRQFRYSFKLYSDRLVVTSFGGLTTHTVLLQDITAWAEVFRSTRNEQLVIKAAGKSFSFTSQAYSNCQHLTDYLTSHVPVTNQQQSQLRKKEWLYVLIQGMVLVALALLYYFFGREYL